jgi:hypothetical protein
MSRVSATIVLGGLLLGLFGCGSSKSPDVPADTTITNRVDSKLLAEEKNRLLGVWLPTPEAFEQRSYVFERDGTYRIRTRNKKGSETLGIKGNWERVTSGKFEVRAAGEIALSDDRYPSEPPRVHRYQRRQGRLWIIDPSQQPEANLPAVQSWTYRSENSEDKRDRSAAETDAFVLLIEDRLRETTQDSKFPDETAGSGRSTPAKFLLVEMLGGKTPGKIRWDWMDQLPSDMRAVKPEELEIVVQVRSRSELRGTYSNGAGAYRGDWDVSLVDWSKRKTVAHTTIVGPEPRYMLTGPTDLVKYGDSTRPDVSKLIAYIKQRQK